MDNNTVYILTNEAMEGYVKIGRTDNLQKRLQDLYNTSVPVPFECHYAAQIEDRSASEVEDLLHKLFDKQRANSRREFFEIDPNEAVIALRLCPHKEVTPGQELDQEDVQALTRVSKKADRFNFNMVNIPKGAMLHFSRDPTIVCTVIDSRRIEFEGEETSLSAAALNVLRRMNPGSYNNPVSGPLYWVFESETLRARRDRMEEGND